MMITIFDLLILKFRLLHIQYCYWLLYIYLCVLVHCMQEIKYCTWLKAVTYGVANVQRFTSLLSWACKLIIVAICEGHRCRQPAASCAGGPGLWPTYTNPYQGLASQIRSLRNHLAPETWPTAVLWSASEPGRPIDVCHHRQADQRTSLHMIISPPSLNHSALLHVKWSISTGITSSFNSQRISRKTPSLRWKILPKMNLFVIKLLSAGFYLWRLKI